MATNRRKKTLTAALAICVTCLGTASAQLASSRQLSALSSNDSIVALREKARNKPLQEAFQSVSLRLHPLDDRATARNIIIIGFVGGFVSDDDVKHPEVQFAALLRNTYSSGIHTEVFSNHHGKEALHRVLQRVDLNGDGRISDSEKEQADIVIYGHSWGASQTVTLARALGEQGLPVLLTIQVDSVRKPGQEDSIIPPNVKNAINFYQTKGLIHGRSTIQAADPTQTRILGNFQMDYRNRRINCDNYPWLARHFDKPHHKIENDPRVWNQIASVIDSELSKTTPMVAGSVQSELMP